METNDDEWHTYREYSPTLQSVVRFGLQLKVIGNEYTRVLLDLVMS